MKPVTKPVTGLQFRLDLALFLVKGNIQKYHDCSWQQKVQKHITRNKFTLHVLPHF